ncbi:hypothetical protein PHYBLDRAFT_162567 [Phycomyces blakesleeanus NRRL 1555(-)]|uniref:Uncharacterized protein n=1 Tax=Phycomyces blakesleeanus (strain ATCC 8743b / DSM 1359 / FGSC 10004 / NBRC 33097 / NRRL 1555) TaxID=763407 RepID=A0A162V2D3_PHYB8|nr:hypothetical protein PHYBLDRAFT_162567 [Phycomyces blakesleeanus NRRL 1555(-)]OAD79503.1 hypothetical protein PHYBLDRAFT_162567 [Phycomyces blakesleeanus NRRL 1555(-)]|eukprot:XP_018297543.1 hypothetical protein PHYBLDRAFT_162567 [Phycomyces blakesleeanus NRRL 1555(-)]
MFCKLLAAAYVAVTLFFNKQYKKCIVTSTKEEFDTILNMEVFQVSLDKTCRINCVDERKNIAYGTKQLIALKATVVHTDMTKPPNKNIREITSIPDKVHLCMISETELSVRLFFALNFELIVVPLVGDFCTIFRGLRVVLRLNFD